MIAASPVTAAIDLGGTNLRSGAIDAEGRVLSTTRVPTPGTLDGIVDAIRDAVADLRVAHPTIAALGVGAAGMVDHDGAILYAPNVPAFRDAPVRARVAAATGLPVVVDNDANVAVLAEVTHGVGVGCSDVLLVTLGTGVGGGIWTGGRLLRGAHGFGAEIGHFRIDPEGPRCACGEVGHWEAVASGHSLGARGRVAAHAGVLPAAVAAAGGDPDAVTGVHVGRAAQAGDDHARLLVRSYAHDVAVGLVGLANILDPEIVVVSGGLVDLGDVLLEPLREAFVGHLEGASYRPTVPILPSALGEQAGLVGAGVLARDLA